MQHYFVNKAGCDKKDVGAHPCNDNGKLKYEYDFKYNCLDFVCTIIFGSQLVWILMWALHKFKARNVHAFKGPIVSQFQWLND